MKRLIAIMDSDIQGPNSYYISKPVPDGFPWGDPKASRELLGRFNEEDLSPLLYVFFDATDGIVFMADGEEMPEIDNEFVAYDPNPPIR